MSFVNLPLEQQLNRENILDRIKKLEREMSARPSGRIQQLGQMGERTGNLIIDGSLDIVNRATGATIMNMDATGLHLDANEYPSSSRMDWLAVDTGVTIAQVVGTYGGALTNSGLLLYGQAHDNGVKGLVYLAANNHVSVTKSSFVLDTSGVMTADMRLGTNTALNTQGLNLKTKVADNNDINNVIYLDSECSGSPAAGFGTAISFRAENSSNSLIDMGYVGYKWTTATAGSESSKAVFGVKDGGTNVDILAVSKSGVNAINANVRSASQLALANNTAFSFTPTSATGAMLIAGGSQGGFVQYNTGTPTMGAFFSSGANFATTTGVLTGTTGAVNNFTVSAHTDGKIYIENRTGASRNVFVLLV
jgi:hypothetical protein